MTALPFISVTFLAFFGIVIGQNVSQTNWTTETFPFEETTSFLNHLKNMETDDHANQTQTTASTVQITHSTREPKPITFKQETSPEPKTTIKIQPIRSTTTSKTVNIPTTTLSSSLQNETAKTTRGTPPQMAIKSSTKEILNALRKPQVNNTTTAMETIEPAQESKRTEVTQSDSVKRFNLPTERKPEATPTTPLKEETNRTTVSQKPENFTVSTEGRDIKDDPIEKEIDEAINSMPKLPELILSDNETHFKFHQDPEEASIDERITQIARQLAETGLRREYEERKLGHFIPISVRPIEYSTPSFISKSKSIKFGKSDVADFRPTHFKSTLLKVLTKARPTTENMNKNTYEVVTNLPEIIRKNKSEMQISEMNGLIKVGEKDFNPKTTDKIPMIPTRIPILSKLFTTQRNLPTESQSSSSTTAKDLTTGGRQLLEDTTYYSFMETTENS